MDASTWGSLVAGLKWPAILLSLSKAWPRGRYTQQENLFPALCQKIKIFCLEDLLSALTKANDDEKVFTDEVSAMLHYFKKDISIYPCNKTNIKVTKKEDLETVEQYLKLAGRI